MPSVTTLSVTDILFDRGTLHGSSEGYDLSPQYSIVGWYGYYDGQDPGDAVPLISMYWSQTGAFAKLRTILASNIKYYCKAFIRIGGGTPETYIWAPNWVDFTTPSTLALVTTWSVQNIAATTATGRGNVVTTTNGISPDVVGGENVTKRGVCWNTTGNPTVADDKAEEVGSFGNGQISVAMTGLPPETKIYVRAYAYNSMGYAYGDEVEFTTLTADEVTTEAASSVGIDHAKGNGTATGDSTERGFEVKLAFSGTLREAVNRGIAGFVGDFTYNTGTGKWEGTLVKTITETGSFVAESFIDDLGRFPIAVATDKLFAAETYDYRARATIGGIVYYGDWVEFITAGYPAGEGPDDIVSPGTPIIEPPPPIEEEEFEWPELIYPPWMWPEFDIPPFEFDPSITFGKTFGAFLRGLDTKKDWITLREKCIIYQENMNEFVLTTNHNNLVIKNLVIDIIAYIDGDVYPSDLELVGSSLQLTPLYLEEISPSGFKDIINDFRLKDVCNVYTLNLNFKKILSSLNSLYESDYVTEPISYNTIEYMDIQPTAKRMILQLEDMRKKYREVRRLTVRNMRRIFTYV